MERNLITFAFTIHQKIKMDNNNNKRNLALKLHPTRFKTLN